MSDRAMAEQSARDMLECMEIENGYDASWYVDTAASLIADRDALAERCEKLDRALRDFIEDTCVRGGLIVAPSAGTVDRARAALAAPKDGG